MYVSEKPSRALNAPLYARGAEPRSPCSLGRVPRSRRDLQRRCMVLRDELADVRDRHDSSPPLATAGGGIGTAWNRSGHRRVRSGRRRNRRAAAAASTRFRDPSPVPVPTTAARSTPRSVASFRTNGDRICDRGPDPAAPRPTRRRRSRVGAEEPSEPPAGAAPPERPGRVPQRVAKRVPQPGPASSPAPSITRARCDETVVPPGRGFSSACPRRPKAPRCRPCRSRSEERLVEFDGLASCFSHLRIVPRRRSRRAGASSGRHGSSGSHV